MALLRSCFRPLVHVGQRQVSWVFGKGLSQLCPPESCFVPEWRIFSCTQTMGCPPKQWPFTLGRIHPRDLNNSLIRKIYIIISLVYHSWVSMTSSNCYSRQGVHRSGLATDPFECELTESYMTDQARRNKWRGTWLRILGFWISFHSRCHGMEGLYTDSPVQQDGRHMKCDVGEIKTWLQNALLH